MPPVPRHAGPNGPTERWPCARKVLTLLCLGWLWATPVAAQDQVPPPAVEATGPYRNLAENHAGTFHLRRKAGVVYATFQTDRSPVQFLARDQPEVLLTVPAGFRPAVDVTWEVSAEPVLPDGTPHPDPSDRRVFRMRVDTEGHVRYVDDAGADGAGYLGYDTALAWPLAGTEPRVCDRHRNIREGILAAVQVLEDAVLPCSQVAWSHLAGIRTLSLDTWDANFARHDLLGLSNLAVLQVFGSGATYPDDLLAYTPRLQALRIEENTLEDLSGDLFRYTPLLAQLSLGKDSRWDLDLPGDLLMHTPHLESLQLEGRHPAELAQQLLAYTPRLTRLTVTSSIPLPETLLANVPRLTHLTVADGLDPCATPELLAPVPDLRHVAVRMTAEDGAPACLDRALRLHTPALAELHLELRDLQGLEAGVLPHLPRLTRLTLDAGDHRLPAQLLAEAPALTHLALHGGTLRLPAGFLAHTPRLTSLSLQAGNLKNVPSDLLAPVPELRQVRVDSGDAPSLPTGFLERVTELRMGTGRQDLPWDFLLHAPHLEVLHLTAHSLRSLPEGFLAHAPRLETFRLDAGHDSSDTSLTSFPEGFLTHAPSLIELRLHVPGLQAFPSSFLGHAPSLETLELENSNTHPSPYRHILPVTSLPANFLIHAPRLRHLDLEPLGHVKAFPPGFLSGSPQLRYLNLDANEARSLPPDFLSRHPHLETIRLRANHVPALPRGFLAQSPRLADLKLDLQRVEALPEGFLADTPRLWNLGLDVHGVAALPPGFLAHTPHLIRLNLRARNLTAWPAAFLADAPRLRTLGLAMPLLEPTLTPAHRLWETLQATSLRVKVIRPDPFAFADSDAWSEFCTSTTISRLGSILEVSGRAPDDHGRMLLRVSGWQERELFAFDSWLCPYLIDSRFTAPTLEVCAAYRDPKECIPEGERSEAPDPEWGREPEGARG
ncbi:MAG: hypothetical protein OXC13_15745 [Caldilineaceae bacterium]|nr:hypothetical protein [Caldilineaceae bacterium]